MMLEEKGSRPPVRRKKGKNPKSGGGRPKKSNGKGEGLGMIDG